MSNDSLINNIKNRDYKYDVIRLFLTLAVVIGHAHYYQMKTNFGGVYISDAMSNANIVDTISHSIFLEISGIIYAFHMPAFFALSGSLFEENNNYKDIKELVKIKARKLLVPCLIVWLFWNIPLKYLSSYYNDVIFYKWFAQILMPYNVYLWYLEALFFVFIIAYILEIRFKFSENKITIIGIALFFVAEVYQRIGGCI